MPVRPACPPAPPPDCLATRRLALRAIMDGRGVEAVVVSSAAALAHYGGPGPGGLLLVTARAARALEVGMRASPWDAAAALLPAGCTLGHEAGQGGGLDALVRRVRPCRIVELSADLARQIAGG